jgi:catechol 2,3-dioxygenase-like lactoylglutathione lyase family enzyme
VHHLALVCSDLQRTIEFYTDVLKMPLVKIVPNRDEPTSTQSGSRGGLLPPSPLRTARTSFPVSRSSLSNVLLRTR